MKKLTIAAALLSLSVAAPVFACPMENHEATPRTADKATKPGDAQGKETAKATETGKAKDAKPAPKADKAKPGDKVSQK
jgi:hypothetical protein